MSQLTFGAYAHAVDSVGIKIDNKIIEDETKQPLIQVTRWTIVGTLRSDGTSGGLASGIANLEAAYANGGQNYNDATFVANGHTHKLTNDTSFSGVRVAAFGWNTGPWKMHTELSNRRSFYAVLQAEYAHSHEVVAYSEEVSQIGTGGRYWKYMPSLVGVPQLQILQNATPVKYIQRGSLTLRSSMPAANAPLFNATYMHDDQTKFTRVAPKLITYNGAAQYEGLYTKTWMYVAEAPFQIGVSDFNTPTLP